MSSIAAKIPAGIYSSTKAFATNLAYSLSLSMNETVDVMSYEPGYVETKMIDEIKSQAGSNMISADRAAEVCFRDVGIDRVSSGDRKHCDLAAAMTWIPDFAFIAGTPHVIKQSKEHLEKEAAKNSGASPGAAATAPAEAPPAEAPADAPAEAPAEEPPAEEAV